MAIGPSVSEKIADKQTDKQTNKQTDRQRFLKFQYDILFSHYILYFSLHFYIFLVIFYHFFISQYSFFSLYFITSILVTFSFHIYMYMMRSSLNFCLPATFLWQKLLFQVPCESRHISQNNQALRNLKLVRRGVLTPRVRAMPSHTKIWETFVCLSVCPQFSCNILLKDMNRQSLNVANNDLNLVVYSKNRWPRHLLLMGYQW